ncbi:MULTISPECIES: PepSY domain-containing protein [unclassified Nitrobacter]|uniref:PepSY domain-containing protein n=1 Tax=unclassified Nitrobacter TaxID=2620411 RepID=UPI00086F2062|nr:MULTISPECIES: PepSY domain-containing protein [unclassified Nitrobacter]MBN9147472.1 PepSY domain-containing protein [Nitrobacter sp.]ODT12722.1 MAG: peptidase [Kaistia sp. SCN 65-12]OJV02929.1 MAG: peptidase [Nitrobacter sp. 62-23]
MKIRYVAIAMAAAMAAAGLAHADQPGADWMPADQVIQKLTAKGYTNFSKVEADDGHWELEADLKGVRYDLHVDPKSGEITKSERDDD